MNSNDKKEELQNEKAAGIFKPSELSGACHPMEGSIQEALGRCVGKHVVAEFLVGTDNMITKSGILYEVGMSYIILYDESAGAYTICDIYAIKFIALVDPSKRGQKRR